MQHIFEIETNKTKDIYLIVRNVSCCYPFVEMQFTNLRYLTIHP